MPTFWKFMGFVVLFLLALSGDTRLVAQNPAATAIKGAQPVAPANPATPKLVPIRVATYNIFFLSEKTEPIRVQRLKEVVKKLNADVIGLQEIENRKALEKVFPKDEWSLVIDDDSDDEQDLAVAVRKPLKVVGLNRNPDDLDADDDDFLFPGRQHERFFPNRRDALVVQVELPHNAGTFFMIVNHWKARTPEGRTPSDSRREEAARLVLQALKSKFDKKDFFVVGDFNDNPDDRSMNILETGDPNAEGEAEEKEGPFLLNLAEPLVANDHVSHGTRVVSGRIDTQAFGSRKRNNDTRGTGNTDPGPILFDQILCPVQMKEKFIKGSAKVFNDAVARLGSNPNTEAASDHLPVYADFAFPSKPATTLTTPVKPVVTTPTPMPTKVDLPALYIGAILPNPDGEDEGKEWVELRNSTDKPLSLKQYTLKDRTGGSYTFDVEIEPGKSARVIDPKSMFKLGNSGGEVHLFDAKGTKVDTWTYTDAQTKVGSVIQRVFK